MGIPIKPSRNLTAKGGIAIKKDSRAQGTSSSQGAGWVPGSGRATQCLAPQAESNKGFPGSPFPWTHRAAGKIPGVLHAPGNTLSDPALPVDDFRVMRASISID
jgi:hypothetical protein